MSVSQNIVQITKPGEGGIFEFVRSKLRSISGQTTLILAMVCIIIFFTIKQLQSYFTRGCEMENFLSKNRRSLSQDETQKVSASDVADSLRNHQKNTQLPQGLRCLKKCEEFPQQGQKGKQCLNPVGLNGLLERLNEQREQSERLDENGMKRWFTKTANVMGKVCRERRLLRSCIDRLQMIRIRQITMSEIRELCKDLLKFQEEVKIGNVRMRSDEEVNLIFGVPLGEPNPTEEGDNNVKRQGVIGVIRLPDPRSVVDLPTQMNSVEGFTNVSDKINTRFYETRDKQDEMRGGLDFSFRGENKKGQRWGH